MVANLHDIHRLLSQNKLAEAERMADDFCRRYPDNVDGLMLLAGIKAGAGRLTEVIGICKKVLALQSDHVMASYNYAVACQSLGRLAKAGEMFGKALALQPDMIAARIGLAGCLAQQGRHRQAVDLYTAIMEQPERLAQQQLFHVRLNLGLALASLKRFKDSENVCRDALALTPNAPQLWNNLGQAMKGQGKLADAAKAHRRAFELKPDFSVAQSNYLLDLNYLPDIDVSKIFDEHRHWQTERQQTEWLPHECDFSDGNRRLRVGYVSPDFRAHSVVLFILGVIESHHRSQVEVFCYSDVINRDGFTERLASVADHWFDSAALGDEQLAHRIAADRIDILVDLAGHTANNRMGVFVYKPAPVQVSWLGYPNTTGLKSMDYRITDEWSDPPGLTEQWHTETLLRLPNGFLCFRPLDDSPGVSKPPCHENGFITFGSFNNSAKINTGVIRLWARILNGHAGSRLLLKSPQLSDEALRQDYYRQFEQAGIAPGRIDMVGRIASTIDHLALYAKVDVALDPFPYNGTTTTCEALWMGVPVVVLAGNSHVGRVGVSLLNQAGLESMVAATLDDYFRIATTLASDAEQLLRLRTTMRERLRQSALLDEERFVTSLESAYRRIWRRCCEERE